MASLDLKVLLELPKLPNYLEAVDAKLTSSIESADPSLSKFLRHILSAKTKRLRPSLLIASGLELRDSEKIITAAAAVELAHLGSLAHDDIIDQADSRWGRPATHVSGGHNLALIAGDFLLAKACAQAAIISSEAGQLLAETIAALATGESLELADRYNLNRSLDSYFNCLEAKTARLISAACRLGGICAGLPPAQIESLADYGHNLGMSFQLIDDLLDILSTSKLMGKPVGNDAKQGIYTHPVLLSLQGPHRSRLISFLAEPNPSNELLADLLMADGSIQKAVCAVKHHNQLALKALHKFNMPNIAGLANLPGAYLNWALGNLVLSQYRTKITNCV